MRYWNVRKNWGYAGGRNHASHATVAAETEELALKVARLPDVHWRRVDSWDIATEEYKEYEILGETSHAAYLSAQRRR